MKQLSVVDYWNSASKGKIYSKCKINALYDFILRGMYFSGLLIEQSVNYSMLPLVIIQMLYVSNIM